MIRRLLMNMSVRSKLRALAALSVVSLVAVGLMGLWGIDSMADIVKVFSENHLPTYRYLISADRDLHRAQDALMRSVDGVSHASRKTFRESFDHGIASLEEHFDKYIESAVGYPGEEELQRQFRASVEGYRSATEGIWSSLLQYGTADEELFEHEARWFEGSLEGLEHLMSMYTSHASELQAEAEKRRSSVTAWVTGISLLAVLVSLLGFLTIVRTIAGSLRILVEHMEALAAGDFTNEIRQKTNDEIGMTFGAMQRVQASVGHIIHQVTRVARRLAEASHSLAETMQETGASIEEVAATSTQLASTVNRVNDSADQMAQAAENISHMAVSGGQALNTAVRETTVLEDGFRDVGNVVDALGVRSQEVEKLVSLIDAIAAQTNLLALNAAIEAARAGSHGRGFAVVAEEVRQLAEDSGAATNEITKLVQEIKETTELAVGKMAEGSQQVTSTASVVGDSGRVLEGILSAIEDIVAQIDGVAAGAREISARSEEVAALTEEQSAAIQHVTVASQALDAMARELAGLVERFNVMEEAG